MAPLIFYTSRHTPRRIQAHTCMRAQIIGRKPSSKNQKILCQLNSSLVHQWASGLWKMYESKGGGKKKGKKKKKQETNRQYSVQGEEKICWRCNMMHKENRCLRRRLYGHIVGPHLKSILSMHHKLFWQGVRGTSGNTALMMSLTCL